ncbi:hypothetical protein Tco_1428622 [Tanacetum coccineum]|uniref:Uncharacterized protein n=1 Tax=Tanacetum coccineum TaxID=301880 RepID=A0ABQ4XVP1_9ASTR
MRRDISSVSDSHILIRGAGFACSEHDRVGIALVREWDLSGGELFCGLVGVKTGFSGEEGRTWGVDYWEMTLADVRGRIVDGYLVRHRICVSHGDDHKSEMCSQLVGEREWRYTSREIIGGSICIGLKRGERFYGVTTFCETERYITVSWICVSMKLSRGRCDNERHIERDVVYRLEMTRFTYVAGTGERQDWRTRDCVDSQAVSGNAEREEELDKSGFVRGAAGESRFYSFMGGCAIDVSDLGVGGVLDGSGEEWIVWGCTCGGVRYSSIVEVRGVRVDILFGCYVMGFGLMSTDEE